MRLAILTFLFFLGLSPAMAGGVDEQRSGKGWIEFHPITASPDYAFLRNFAQTREDYERSKEYGSWVWDVDELKVGYWDLNDDGVEELFLSYAEVSVYHCGNGGCWMYLFQKQGDEWREIDQFSQFGVFVTDEKVGGYRTLYPDNGLRSGYRHQWTGSAYKSDCPENVPLEISDDGKSNCSGPGER